MPSPDRSTVPAITVHQWLPAWDATKFNSSHLRRRPEDHFYLLSLPPSELLSLSGIYRRSSAGNRPRTQDLGIQRQHDGDRSAEIRRFVSSGFPWSNLTEARRESGEFQDLIKPGWLPTAVVVNILRPDDKRNGQSVNPADLIEIAPDGKSLAQVTLPSRTTEDWSPKSIPPIEVIDGQHRLWAFVDEVDNYEIPVVAFYGLDLSWQAYLFYTINIRPKRINTSLAYDLYPLLRTEDWLEKFDGHSVYRETRSQELTEALWSYPKSPWHGKINMLGETGLGQVTQASWIRSLQATFVKPSEGRRVQIGGLFGAPAGEHRMTLPWTRTQQAAFLIYLWMDFAESVRASEEPWAMALREAEPSSDIRISDPAFEGSTALATTDIGVRGFLFVTNDFCFVNTDELALAAWLPPESGYDGIDASAIDEALSSLAKLPISAYINELGAVLATYDWRTSSAPGLTIEESQPKGALQRGDRVSRVTAGSRAAY
jgi:DGQHR domain-containing protein